MERAIYNLEPLNGYNDEDGVFEPHFPLATCDRVVIDRFGIDRYKHHFLSV